MIIERVPAFGTPQMPPSNEQRWDAVKELYRVLRNQEHEHKHAAKAAGEFK